MYRNVLDDMVAWYEERSRRILSIKGASGVGKTWIVKDFAAAYYGSLCYIGLRSEPLFVDALSNHSLEDFDSLLTTKFLDCDFTKALIVLDNTEYVDDCSEFLHKYRKLHANYALCIISSTMVISEYEYTHPDLFNIIRMRPMSFEEYMIANKASTLLTAIENQKYTPLNEFENAAILNHLKEYMLTGGMPAVVKAFIKTKDYSVIRPLQEQILEKYRQLILSSAPYALSQKCKRVWKSIPEQLRKDNKKFMYKYVEDNARGREYVDSIQLLCDLGLVRKLPRLNKANIPLEENADHKSFELFFIDHGLLRAMYDLPVDESLSLIDILEAENGAIAEQYIFQELSNKINYIYYWVSGATARVPFVYEGSRCAVPVDIRFKPAPKAQNIKTFLQRCDADIYLKISLEQAGFDNNILNIPAYGIWYV